MGKPHYVVRDQGLIAYMNLTDIGVWSCGRTSSSRCPNKMIRSFHDTTLTDIVDKIVGASKQRFLCWF